MSTPEIGKLEAGLRTYNQRLSDFIRDFKLPKQLFFNPDCIVLGAADMLEASKFARDEVLPKASWANATMTDGGLVIHAALKKPLAAVPVGEHSWARIEPGVTQYPKPVLRFSEYFYPELSDAQARLAAWGAMNELTETEERSYVDIVSPEGTQVRLTNRPFAVVAEDQRASGQTTEIKL